MLWCSHWILTVPKLRAFFFKILKNEAKPRFSSCKGVEPYKSITKIAVGDFHRFGCRTAA
jgi:hypothetical protein